MLKISKKFAKFKGKSISRYTWGNRKITKAKKLSLSWGALPIYRIDIENDTACLYRRINGSRDGWMSFPERYFDEKKVLLDIEKKKELFDFLQTFDFTKWITDEVYINNIERGACGFCVSESFKCIFKDNTEFYCAYPPQDQFKKMVEYFKTLFPGENMDPFM